MASDQDTYGYGWHNEITGSFFEDISKTGTEATFDTNNDGSAPIELPFPFSFYGQHYTIVYASINGILTVGGQSSNDSYKNREIPSTTPPNLGIIAPFWDDLDPKSTGKLYYKNFEDGQKKFIIQWDKWGWYRSTMNGQTATFQVWLLPEFERNNKKCDIYFIYKEFTGMAPGNSYTVGIESVVGNLGLQIHYNTDNGVRNDYNIHISAPYPPYIRRNLPTYLQRL